MIIQGATKVIGVLAGKGGAGKSTVTVLLAHALKEAGYKVGILDSDICGSSIPLLLGDHADDVYTYCGAIGSRALPAQKNGIQVVSMAILNEDEGVPLIWDPEQVMIFTKQALENNEWDVDYLLIDFPPGSEVVNQTIIQYLENIQYLFVAQAQEVVRHDVLKSINLVKYFKGNILGMIENRATGDPREVIQDLVKETGVKLIDRIPELPLDGSMIQYAPILKEYPGFMDTIIAEVQ